MIPVQVRFTKRLLERIDELVKTGLYSNRSEAVRDATRRHIENHHNQKESKKGK